LTLIQLARAELARTVRRVNHDDRGRLADAARLRRCGPACLPSSPMTSDSRRRPANSASRCCRLA